GGFQQDGPARGGQRGQSDRLPDDPRALRVPGHRGPQRRRRRAHGARRPSGPDPDGHFHSHHRWVGGHAHPQGRRGHQLHSHHRPHRACPGHGPGQGHRGGLRRVPGQALRAAARGGRGGKVHRVRPGGERL
ncbi:MAG: Signal transduction response regulator, partial [uncultured Gemmatimonadetes bacterium]